VISDWGSPRQRVLTRSAAVLYAAAQLRGWWGPLARAARLVPRAIADRVYTFVATRRYRLFGRFDACPLPRPEWRNRFLDQS
jgi:predicted DCC family thiol-disulfide oxidoreductase YuxK